MSRFRTSYSTPVSDRVINVITYGAKADRVDLSDVTITSGLAGAATVSSSSYSFTGNDVGKCVLLTGNYKDTATGAGTNVLTLANTPPANADGGPLAVWTGSTSSFAAAVKTGITTMNSGAKTVTAPSGRTFSAGSKTVLLGSFSLRTTILSVSNGVATLTDAVTFSTIHASNYPSHSLFACIR